MLDETKTKEVGMITNPLFLFLDNLIMEHPQLIEDLSEIADELEATARKYSHVPVAETRQIERDALARASTLHALANLLEVRQQEHK